MCFVTFTGYWPTANMYLPFSLRGEKQYGSIWEVRTVLIAVIRINRREVRFLNGES